MIKELDPESLNEEQILPTIYEPDETTLMMVEEGMYAPPVGVRHDGQVHIISGWERVLATRELDADFISVEM